MSCLKAVKRASLKQKSFAGVQHAVVLAIWPEEPPPDEFSEKNGRTKMVNKAVFGRRLRFLTAENNDSSYRNHSCREYDEKTRNFLNIKVDYRSKEEKNLMIGPYAHQLYF